MSRAAGSRAGGSQRTGPAMARSLPPGGRDRARGPGGRQPPEMAKMPIEPLFTVAGSVMLATVFELSTGTVAANI